MNVEQKAYSVRELVEALESGQLIRNPDYQRGAAWSEVQKAGFIDSIFRGYPVPALFFHESRLKKGLGQQESSRYEIVDGQQRLTALKDFINGRFPLQPISADSKLRLPKSVRERPAPWAGRLWGDLSEGLQQSLLECAITVFQIAHDAEPDEIRDLFIRLQSGTALSRQQVRDAWPGKVGPFIERVAGKMDKRPSRALFQMIDRRGQGLEEEDDRDPYANDRQYCAQLLQVFISRERDAHVYPNVGAAALDALYHEHTDFDEKGEVAQRFLEALDRTQSVLARLTEGQLGKNRKKVRKLEVMAIFMFFQDMLRSGGYKLSDSQLAERIRGADTALQPAGKTTSAATLERYYEWWRLAVAKGVGIKLDKTRLFSEEQKEEISSRDSGTCQVCRSAVEDGDAEYDHHPISYRDGGLTEVDNGRLVHKLCHPRGRPKETS